MPLDRLVLILVCVMAAAGLTVWIGALVAATWSLPGLGLVLLPVVMVLYILWRVIAQRLGEDDRYDRTPRD